LGGTFGAISGYGDREQPKMGHKMTKSLPVSPKAVVRTLVLCSPLLALAACAPPAPPPGPTAADAMAAAQAAQQTANQALQTAQQAEADAQAAKAAASSMYQRSLHK
jgi:hypothetical protein